MLYFWSIRTRTNFISRHENSAPRHILGPRPCEYVGVESSRGLKEKTHYLLFKGITKPCTQLHPVLSTSTQLHLPPSSSLQHPQQYLNQNIARNWAISPNLGQKIKSCSFWLKIGAHGILEALIPNPDLDFWNSNPKAHFWANLGLKIQSCPSCLKIGAHSISRMLIPNPDLDF